MSDEKYIATPPGVLPVVVVGDWVAVVERVGDRYVCVRGEY